MIKRLILLLQFYTTIPIPFQFEPSSQEFGKALALSPVVGMFLGLILFVGYSGLLLFFSPLIAAVLIMVLYIILTGGLHLDGLGDTFDGLFSNRPKEQMLEIMKDSRIGMNAALGVFCTLLLNITVISQLAVDNPISILLLPIAGRTGIVICASLSTYPRLKGTGKDFIQNCTKKELTLALVLHFIFFLAFGGLWSLVVGIICVLSSLFFTFLLTRRIGGATGDILGAVCELTQCAFLLASYLVF